VRRLCSLRGLTLVQYAAFFAVVVGLWEPFFSNIFVGYWPWIFCLFVMGDLGFLFLSRPLVIIFINFLGGFLVLRPFMTAFFPFGKSGAARDNSIPIIVAGRTEDSPPYHSCVYMLLIRKEKFPPRNFYFFSIYTECM